MKTINLWNNNTQVEDFIFEKENELNKEGIESETKYTLSEEELKLVQYATQKEEYLETHDDETYLENVKNWVIILKEWEKIIWFIFNFNYKFKTEDLYERWTLWVDWEYRWLNLWKYLMFKMTQHLNWKSIISVTSNPIVQKINEILMEYEVTSPEWDFKESLEENWPLNDKYRYFITEKIAELLG